MVFVHNFKGYKISYTRGAQKEFDRIDSIHAKSIKKKFEDMVEGLQNVDVKRLQGGNELFRLRVGNYRAIFEAHEHIITILIVAVSHRKDIYD